MFPYAYIFHAIELPLIRFYVDFNLLFKLIDVPFSTFETLIIFGTDYVIS